MEGNLKGQRERREKGMKVLVLGAGVVGVTTAWFLNKSGHDVTVLERRDAAGMETSFANGGQISVSHGSRGPTPLFRLRLTSGNGCGASRSCANAPQRARAATSARS